MSEKLSQEEWKAQVLKLLENTPIGRPKTISGAIGKKLIKFIELLSLSSC